MKYKKLFTPFAVFVFLAAIATFSMSYGQTPQSPNSAESQQAAGGDPIRQLNLTPEQREQIRSIRQQTNGERAAINQRVGEANRALEAALDSDNPDESSVEQTMKDLAAAQAAAMRMRIATEVRIRRVLTVEQRAILRALRLEAREMQRELLEMRDQRQRRRDERPNLRNQRNGLGPLFPTRNINRPASPVKP